MKVLVHAELEGSVSEWQGVLRATANLQEVSRGHSSSIHARIDEGLNLLM